MRLCSTNKRLQRGAAATEMALLMIIIVPLLMFVSFAGDAVYHQLEVQETVITTVWDFSTTRFGSVSNASASSGTSIAGGSMTSADSLAGYNRTQYADHDSSYSNNTRVNQGNWMNEEHHTNAFGQVSWCDGTECRNTSPYSNMTSGQQVFCRINRGGKADKFSMDVIGGTAQLNKYSEGGVVECWAKGWLMNYILSDTFISDFPGANKTKLFNKKLHDGNVHQEHATGGQNATADILLRYRAGMLVDSWAALDHFQSQQVSSTVKHRDTGLGQTDTLFFKRSEAVFQNPLWYWVAVGGVSAYAGKAGQKKIGLIVPMPMMGPIFPPGFPEMLSMPNPVGLWMVAKSHDNNRHKDRLKDYEFKPTLDVLGKSHMTTPLYDDFRSAWQNRGNNYMGARTAETR